MWQTEIGNYGSFFALLPPPLKTQKIWTLKKWKKLLDISFYTCVPKTTIMWGTVPEIRNETDGNLCHFGPFFALLHPDNPKNQNLEKMKKWSGDVIILHMSTKNQDHMGQSIQEWISRFCGRQPLKNLLSPLLNILSHRMYAPWDMECGRHDVLSFCVIFSPFFPLLTPKIKIWKKCKRNIEILSFYTCVPYMKIIWCMVPEI